MFDAESQKIEARAANVWRSSIENRRSISVEELERAYASLIADSETLQDTSLRYAANQLKCIYREGITGLNFMGTMGSGKSSLAMAVATKLDWEFRDADYFHSDAAIEKMSANIPLTTEDRIPFLKGVANFFKENPLRISTCSALHDSYRAFLAGCGRLPETWSTKENWDFKNANLGLIEVLVLKKYELALSELDRAEKGSNIRQFAGKKHFINVSKSNPILLDRQFALLEATPLKPWQAITIVAEKYNLEDGSYDAEGMANDTLHALGFR